MFLISAAGSGGTNRIVEGVNKEDFIGITNDRYKFLASVLKKNYLVPIANQEDLYIKKVNEIIKDEKITLFIPNSDREVFVVTKNIQKIDTNTFLPDLIL